MTSSAVSYDCGCGEAEGRVRILGLDPSLTSFGIARLHVDGTEWTELETTSWSPNVRGVHRLEWFHDKLEDLVLAFHPQTIVLEGYAYGVARGNAAVSMGELGGIVRFLLLRMGVQPVIIPPATLKKFVTGKGNANKDVMMKEAYKRFGIDANTSDECDAASLAMLAAVGKYGMRADLPKVNLEAIKNIDWSGAVTQETG